MMMLVGSPTVQHRAIICKQSLVNWWAAWLCGVERGEFGGPCPFGPNTLPQDMDKNNDPEDIWLESYVNDFLETPFYWICGLQTFIPIKNIGEWDDGDPKKDSALTNLDEVRIDENQEVWCFPTMVERAQWLLDYLKGTIAGPVGAKRVGAFVTSKSCHATQYAWQLALEEPGRILPHYEKFRIPAGTHSKPADIAEAHLDDSQQGSDLGVYGAWKAQFEAWLDYVAQYWMTDSDVVLFSDREAKDMVVQQYDLSDPPVTVDSDRLQAIVDVLIDINPATTKWQIEENEWQYETPRRVTRPPDYVKITIDEEDEYYSLSEAYFHILSALNDLANDDEIDYKTLEPVIGPCEPSVCPETTSLFLDEEDSVYRVLIWWQHNYFPLPKFRYQDILDQIPALYEASFTDLVGPTFPDSSRRKRLRKVKALWNFIDSVGNNNELNASELLYVMAKALYNHYHSLTEEMIEILPSHVLPIGYYKFLRNGRFKLVFGEENQLNWLDLGQRWTLKPAILNETYR